MSEFMECVLMIADAGVYVEYDTWGSEGNWPANGLIVPSDTERLDGIKRLVQNGYLAQILLSQDICHKIGTMAYGGPGRTHILRDILPLFRKEGITEGEIRAMLVDNPKKILQFV